jgi:hypothetical protein
LSAYFGSSFTDGPEPIEAPDIVAIPSTVVGTGSDTLVDGALVRIIGAEFGPKALALCTRVDVFT